MGLTCVSNLFSFKFKTTDPNDDPQATLIGAGNYCSSLLVGYMIAEILMVCPLHSSNVRIKKFKTFPGPCFQSPSASHKSQTSILHQLQVVVRIIRLCSKKTP